MKGRYIMNKLLVFALALLLMLFLVGCNTEMIVTSQDETKKEEIDKVMETLNYLFEGIDNRDGEIAKKVFAPNAMVYCNYYKLGYPAEAYCDRYFSHNSYMRSYDGREVIFIDIAKNIATARVDYFDTTGEYAVTVYYQLRRKGLSWEIINGNHNN